MSVEVKKKIENGIKAFAEGELKANTEHLLNILGYSSKKKTLVNIDSLKLRAAKRNIENVQYAHWQEWKNVQLIFQITADEAKNENSLFEFNALKDDLMQSYLFFAIELTQSSYNRSTLSSITRFVNRLYDMPVMILFKHGSSLTFSVINRRLSIIDINKDVLLKVTLIKDINIENPHRAHIEILFDLSFEELKRKYNFSNFIDLHNSWQKTLDTKELNKQFFQELFNWYLWALKYVKFPQLRPEEDLIVDKVHQSESLIRLLTRILFCWFMKEKGLIKEELFQINELRKILNKFSGVNSEDTIYYKAILQNLFFATLSKPIKDRKVIEDIYPNPYYGDPLVYRYTNLFSKKDEILSHFENIPFLNGGLFDCLDQRKDKDNPVEIRLDGFSETKSKQPAVPDKLFFGEYPDVDLSVECDDKKKAKLTVHGLIDILDRYKFTIEENTPVEEEIALDPELLGKVFENLLAYYNPETNATARKQTGSFYTPREIVNYMIDESLIAYLIQSFGSSEGKDIENRLRSLLSYTEEKTENQFNTKETITLLKAINNCKVLDPACGSGAFPMGVLQKMLLILRKLDPDNKHWFEMVIAGFPAYLQSEMRSKLQREKWDYVRKLGIIQECIYGIDIQPIATQIAKLRFFISLLVDQTEKPELENRGFEPLPNLDFKIVTANTLISAPKSDVVTTGLFINHTDSFFETFDNLTGQYFSAKTPEAKKDLNIKITKLITEKCNEKIKEIESKHEATDERVSKALKEKHKKFIEQKESEIKLWQSYTNLFKHEAVGFFEPQYFFPKATDGFDIVIGNPPYISTRTKDFDSTFKEYFKTNYSLAIGQYDLFTLFIEKSNYLLNKNGILSFIIPKKLLTNENFEEARKFLLKHLPVTKYVDAQMPFEAASVEANVIVSTRNIVDKIKTYLFDGDEILYKYEVENTLIELMPFSIFPFAICPNNVVVIDSILKKCSASFGDYLSIIRGMECGFNHPSISTNKSKYKIIKGEHLSRYNIKETDWYIKPDFSDTKIFKSKDIYLKIPKLLTKFVSISIDIALDNFGYFNTNVVYNIHPQAGKEHLLKYFLALGNSMLVNFWFINTYVNDDKLFPHIQKNQLDSIPVILPKNEKSFILLVDQILSAKEKNPKADTSQLEKQIDEMVYKLYELTYEEVKVIDPEFSLTEKEYEAIKLE